MITNSIIAYGDRLGAQMSTLANLIYIAEENKQQIVFYDEIKGFRRHLQFFDVFDMGDYVKLIQPHPHHTPPHHPPPHPPPPPPGAGGPPPPPL